MHRATKLHRDRGAGVRPRCTRLGLGSLPRVVGVAGVSVHISTTVKIACLCAVAAVSQFVFSDAALCFSRVQNAQNRVVLMDNR